MANVNIKFNNKEFLLSCEDGQEEHLEELASNLNEKFDKLKSSLGNIGENKLLYMEKPEVLSKSDYNLIHKDTAKKLLSTNNEKWNTIPRTYSEIDTLRAKFEKEGQPEKLVILDEINAYVEELEKIYSSV